jgi:hypothetical protein
MKACDKKVPNKFPRPDEKQNCQLESKDKCELVEKLRPRKAKSHSHH